MLKTGFQCAENVYVLLVSLRLKMSKANALSHSIQHSICCTIREKLEQYYFSHNSQFYDTQTSPADTPLPTEVYRRYCSQTKKSVAVGFAVIRHCSHHVSPSSFDATRITADKSSASVGKSDRSCLESRYARRH